MACPTGRPPAPALNVGAWHPRVLWNGDHSLTSCAQVIHQLRVWMTTILLSLLLCSHIEMATSKLFSGFGFS